MANSIEIEIVANFKDNATDQVKELNAELDKLEKRNIDITAKIDSMNANIDRWTSQSIIGSKPEQAVEKVKEFSEKILSGTTKMTIDVDDNATPKLKGVQRTMDELEKAEKRVQFRPHSSGNYTPMYDYHPTPVDSSRKFHGSLSASAEKVKTGELEGSAERIADELSDINHSAKSYVPKGGYTYNDDAVRAIEITPLEEEADRRLLEQDARTMGIKFSSKTSNDELSQKIADYEDKNYWSKQGSQSNREIVSAGEEQGEEITDGYLTSLGQGMKQVTSKVASRFMGARMLYKGISDAASDFTSAFEAENGLDRQRGLARSATKAGLMGTGALVGSLVGMPMLGAGAGALVSDLFGDDLADALSGIHKSAAELAQAHIDELFGDIAMSADEMMVVVKGLTDTTRSIQMGYNQQSIQTEYALAQSSTDSYYDLKEQGSRMEILNNLGLKTDKSERATYKQSVEDYTDGLKKQLLQEMYDSFAVNDDLYGYGNWDASGLSKKYEDTYGDLEKTTKDLFKYLDRAFSDNDFSTDEIEHVATVLSGLKELSTNAGPDEFAVNNEKYNWLLGNGMLSKEAYDAFQGDIWSNLDNQIDNIANTRARAVLENPNSSGDAEKNAGNQIVSAYETTSKTWLNGFEQRFGDDYTTALEKAYNGGDDFWNGPHGLYNLTNPHEKIKAAQDSWMARYERTGDASWLRTGLGSLKDSMAAGFNEVDGDKQGVFAGEYATVSPQIAKMEQSLEAASKIPGVDISAPMDELMKMYSIGAMGQDEVAKNKFTAMYMAQNKEYADLINKAYNGDIELMNKSRLDGGMGEGFGDAWKLIFGQNQEGSEKVENQLTEAGEKIKEAGENAAKQASEAAGDTASAATETVEDNTNTATETIKDKTDSMFDGITDTIEQSNEKADEAAKGAANELGENILNAIGESLDNIDADMLGESGIGEKLMNSIAESLSADNMDFGELSIGQSILEGISSSFEGVEFGELDIGAKIMDAISASLEGVDFSGITEGITSQFQELSELQCDIELNAQDNITDMATAADTAVREIPETWETTLSAVDNASAIANSVAEAVNAIPTSVNVSITATTSGFPAGFHFASGTPNAPEGMAWLNDDGTADPRELIEHNGQFMMYEGRDVLAPLSKGDRVFTSAQTKDILSGKGIPHFAEGVNNEVIATNRETIGSGSSGASVSIDGVNINITIEGNSNGNVVEEIRQRSGEIAEIVTAEIQRHLSASFANSSGGDD